MILGLQAEGLAATPKHFAVYSIPVGGRDGGTRTDPHVAPREMKTLYLEPFRKGIQEAGALGVMRCFVCRNSTASLSDTTYPLKPHC